MSWIKNTQDFISSLHSIYIQINNTVKINEFFLKDFLTKEIMDLVGYTTPCVFTYSDMIFNSCRLLLNTYLT